MRLPFSDLASFRRDALDFFTTRGRSAAEPLVRLEMGIPAYLVTDPNLTKPIFRAPEREIDKGRLIYKLREIMGESSISLSGPRHRVRRQAMHDQLARGLQTAFVPQLSSMVRRELLLCSQRPSVDAHLTTARLAVRIIAFLLFGEGALTRADEDALVTAVDLVEEDLAAELFRLLPDLPWVRARKKAKLAAGRQMMDFVVDRARRRATRASLLNALEALELSERELRDEILLLFLAGHHTSGTAMAWLLYHIAIEPDLRRALAAEAASVTNAGGDLDGARLPRATLSLDVAREILRLYPPAHWMSRETKEAVEIAGIKLKKGTSLIVSPWHMQRDPRFWEAPDTFKLGRDHLRNPAWTPFGAGPRICVGMGVAMIELQILALEAASSFELAVLSEVPAPRPTPRVTIVPPPISLCVKPAVATSAAPPACLDSMAQDPRPAPTGCPYHTMPAASSLEASTAMTLPSLHIGKTSSDVAAH